MRIERPKSPWSDAGEPVPVLHDERVAELVLLLDRLDLLRRGRRVLEQRRDRAARGGVRERERRDADEEDERDEDQEAARDVPREPVPPARRSAGRSPEPPPFERRLRQHDVGFGGAQVDYLATRWLSHIWL